MPSKTDFENLISKEYTDGGVWKNAVESGYCIAGRVFTGKGEFSDNSVFFPAAGNISPYDGKIYQQGKAALYWTSAPTFGITMGEDAGSGILFSSKRDNGYSVRAVLR